MPHQHLKALNERHYRFIASYLEDLNAARAARRAGFSSKSADRIAHDLLKDPLVQQELNRQRDELAKEVGVTPALVLREYMRVAFAQLSHLAEWDEDGLHVKPSAALRPQEIAAIMEMSSITRTSEGGETTTIKLKLHSKLKALDAIARHLDMKLVSPGDPDAAREGKGKRGVSDVLTPEDLRRIKREVYGLEEPAE